MNLIGVWTDISQLEVSNKPVVLISKTKIGGRDYITDPWCGWMHEDGSFARWPHKFQPTHFLKLPEFVG